MLKKIYIRFIFSIGNSIKEGDPKVKDRLKGYLSFFIMHGKSRRVRLMDFFFGGGVEDNTDN